MKGLLTPSPGVGGGGLDSSSSSLRRHRLNEVSLRSSRKPSPSDGPQPHQSFAVFVPFKPRYVPKPDTRPQVASKPHHTINAPFRPSRKIISKEVLAGGSITYHLGAFWPSSESADNAVPDIIQVSATCIDDHVSYEELERFEHEEFESELAKENEELEKLERRQTRDLLQGSFKRGRGRPKKHQGLLNPLNFRRELLGHASSDVDEDSGETESEIASTDVEGTVRSDRRRAFTLKTPGGKTFERVRVEIPIRASEEERTVFKSVLERNKPRVETRAVPNRLELIDDSMKRSTKGNVTLSLIGSSQDRLISSRDGAKVTVKSAQEFSSYKSKDFEHKPVASSTTQTKTGIKPVMPDITTTVDTASRKGRPPSPEVTYRGRQKPVDQPRTAPVHITKFSPPKNLKPIDISDEEGDDEDSKDHVQSTEIPPSKRTTHYGTGSRTGKAILTSHDPKSSIKDYHEYTGGAESDEEADILLSHFAPTTSNSKFLRSRSTTQNDFPHRHQSSKVSKPTATSPLSNDELQNQPHAPPALHLSNPPKRPNPSPAFIPDTDSEDDLAAGEQLLKEFEGEKTRATDTADSLLRRFQKQPMKHIDPPPSPPQPPAHKKPNKPKSHHKYLTSPSSKHHRPSMTAPFPSGKPVRRGILPATKGKLPTGANKAVDPPGESENDSSTKKRKRDKPVERWRTVWQSDDSEAEWSPKR